MTGGPEEATRPSVNTNPAHRELALGVPTLSSKSKILYV